MELKYQKIKGKNVPNIEICRCHPSGITLSACIRENAKGCVATGVVEVYSRNA